MKKLRVAVVGVGYLGQFHAEKYAQMKDVQLVAVADINPARADEIAKRLKVPAIYDHNELIGKVDAVSIVVPTSEHYQVSKNFLSHEIDLLIEKPITTTLEQADELIGLAEEKGLIIQVGHLERFNSAVVALEDIVKQPLFIESDRLSVFKDRGTDVSVVLDLMIHDIDIISNFVKSEVHMIRAAGAPVITKKIDIANARLEFTSGCIANVTASRISLKNERKIRLFQRDAYVSVDFAKRNIMVIQRNDAFTKGIIPGMDIQNLSFNSGDALEDELRSFVNAVSHRLSPEVTGQMGRDALKIVLTISEQILSANRRFL
jgi:predicted dehydrogenase